jgi:SAM-dependent methyltransferase
MIDTIKDEIIRYSSMKELKEEVNFLLRRRALESLAIFKQLFRQQNNRERLQEVVEPAQMLEAIIHETTAAIFQRYRPCFFEQTISPQELRALLDRFTTYRPGAPEALHYAEENLDYFIDAILGYDLAKIRRPRYEDEMVHLERTPAGAVLEMLDRVELSEASLFIDLGSGLGHVIFLVALLAGIRVVGIEIEAAYYQESLRVQQQLGLPTIELIHKDVRGVDLERGTVFFLFTPFTGSIMTDVLRKLSDVGKRKPITVCSYGQSTLRIQQEPWLRVEADEMLHPYRLAIFHTSAESKENYHA